MVSQPIYEALPFGYLLTGSSLILLSESGLLWFSGGLFFSAGAMIWVLRSSFRRRTTPFPNSLKKMFMPEWMYEAKPFSYFLFGIFSFHVIQQLYLIWIPFVFILHGWQLFLRRTHHRKHRIPHSVFG